MAYTLEYSDDAIDDLDKLDNSIASRIIGKLETLAENAEIISHVPLKGQWSGYFRIRISNYRAIYDLDREAEIILVEAIGHRRDIYDE